MKYLIFGGSGFVGRNLVELLSSNRQEVISVSRSGTENSIALDITDESEFSKLKVVPDIIINCASVVPSKGKNSQDPVFLEQLFLTNVIGAANISNWARRKGVSKIINCSTLVVVEKPWPIPLTEEHGKIPRGFHVGYAMSKLSQEQIMNQCLAGSDTQILHARLSAVYGPGMPEEGLIFSTILKLLNNDKIQLTDAKRNSVDLIFIQDLCEILFRLSYGNFSSSIVNVASGEETSVFNIVQRLKSLANSNSVVEDVETKELASRAVISINKMKNILEKDFKITTIKKGLLAVFTDFVAKKDLN